MSLKIKFVFIVSQHREVYMRSKCNEINEMLAKVRARAEEVLGEKHFEYWLKTPKQALGNKIPLELANTKQGSEKVLNLLGRIEHGIFS